MNNPIIVSLKDGGGWIQPRSDHYEFLTSPPKRIGDHALILVGKFTTSGPNPSIVKVIWLEAVNGFTWLVEVK